MAKTSLLFMYDNRKLYIFVNMAGFIYVYIFPELSLVFVVTVSVYTTNTTFTNLTPGYLSLFYRLKLPKQCLYSLMVCKSSCMWQLFFEKASFASLLHGNPTSFKTSALDSYCNNLAVWTIFAPGIYCPEPARIKAFTSDRYSG